jgi:sulfide:quinone oxidoreductase
MPADAPTRVVIAGGGVAALEAALALRDLAGDRVALTLVSPADHFAYRPLTVGEPFAMGDARSLPLRDVARDVGAELVQGALASVDAAAHEAVLGDGSRIAYDALLVAVGARRVPALENATPFRGHEDAETLHGLIQDLEGGYVRRVAFVVPSGVSWPLPLYELALMSAQRAHSVAPGGVELTVVTPEEGPLIAFGATASAEVQRLLDEAGVRVEASTRTELPARGRLVLHPGGRTLEAERIIALPVVEAIPIEGLPSDSAGFTPVEADGRVSGLDGVYAAGDGTAFPVKQGGLAAQQADAAASSIARAAGAAAEPLTFKPILRGELLTGAHPLFLKSDISGGGGDVSLASEEALWWPPCKVAGRYLAPYLAERLSPPR